MSGLLDFQQPIDCGSFTIYYPFEGRGPHRFTPDRLAVAMSPDGVPELRLQLYRGRNAMLPPSPYGVLQLRLQLHSPVEQAAKQLAARHSGSRLEPAAFAGDGFLRLHTPLGVKLPPALSEPIRLAWNGLAHARCLLRLTTDEAMLLKRLLQDETMPVQAQAEFELAGIAPRLPLRVRVHTAPFRAALAAWTDADGRIARGELVKRFAAAAMDWTTIGLELRGDVNEAIGTELAETLADWVRTRYGVFAASPVADGQGYMALRVQAAGTDELDRLEWDLSQPLETWRPLVLQLQPFDEARRLIREAGIESIVPPSIVVPPLPHGVHMIDVDTSIPADRPGVAAIGVTLRAAPRPPARPQAVTVSAELAPPADTAAIRLQLSPAEPLAYTYSTFVIVEHAAGAHQLDGPELPAGEDRLYLKPDAFPVRFVPQGAQPSLLETADVHGRCRWTESDGKEIVVAFPLSADRPEAAVPLPLDAAATTVEYELREREGNGVLRLPPAPLEPRLLGLHSWPEYGAHEVVVEWKLPPKEESQLGPGLESGLEPTSTPGLPFSSPRSDRLLALELLPEDRLETKASVIVLALTLDQPRKSFTYFAASPFRAGYRYRRRASASSPSPPEAWSDLRSPFEPLLIQEGE
ncbi:hypothetical protein [Paenibacillus koleovorans]|uniref:hypothetical protein n=1 Tax=Paenibacillus koleovorans TaxID=121608 RepID=UPI000FD8D325|nr:hypothetical protein [Paenibacillus koleovorans]